MKIEHEEMIKAIEEAIRPNKTMAAREVEMLKVNGLLAVGILKELQVISAQLQEFTQKNGSKPAKKDDANYYLTEKALSNPPAPDSTESIVFDALMSRDNQPMSCSEIAKIGDCSETSVSETVKGMKKDGLLKL